MIDTGALTVMLLGHLSGGDPVLLAGDGVAPAEGGWTGGTPNTGGFVAYSVLTFQGASPTHPEIEKADPEWATRWSMSHYGGSRAQADWVATASRGRVLTALKQRFGESDVFKVVGITWTNLGAMSRNDQVDPPYWSASDTLILTASRVRNPTP